MRRQDDLTSIMKRLLFGFFLLFFSVGCMTAPKKVPSESLQGTWVGRILVRDLKSARSQVLKFEAQGKRDDVLRLEVTATMGVPVAIFLVRPDETQYLLIREKRHIIGPTSPRVLAPVFTAPVDPAILFNVFFNSPLDNSWVCQQSPQDSLDGLCESESIQSTVSWKTIDGLKSKIQISHNEADVQIEIKSFKPEISDSPDLFQLTRPKNFKTYRLKKAI